MTRHYQEDENSLQPSGDSNVEPSIEKTPAASGTHASTRENAASDSEERNSTNSEPQPSKKFVRNRRESGDQEPAQREDARSGISGSSGDGSTAPAAEETLESLESQGFTREEAERLVQVSDQLSRSGEAAEAEATMRRLRFTKWLVDTGILSDSAPQE